MAKLRIAEWQKLIGKQGRDNSIQQEMIFKKINMLCTSVLSNNTMQTIFFQKVGTVVYCWSVAQHHM